MGKVLLGNIYDSSGSGSEGPQGPQGPQGIQGVPGAVGPAGLTWRGVWSSGAAYAINDVVSSVGTNGIATSYFAIQSGINHAPTEGASNAWWALLAQEGATGAQGIQGIQGVAGNPATNLVTSVQGKQGVVTLVAGDIGSIPSTDGIERVQRITDAEYTALGTKDADTLYVIV